jgi:hypothetical protein
MVDSEQEKTESTQERNGGGGIHRLRLDSSSASVEQNDFKKLPRRYVTKSPSGALSLECSGSLRAMQSYLTSAKIPNTFGWYLR